MEKFLLVVAVMVMLVGLAGSVLPVLPGIPLIFLGILGYAWYEGFHQLTPSYVAIMGGLALLSVIVDYLAGAWGAKRYGSSQAGVLGAVLGALLGLFFGPLGIIIGPWVGAFVGEWIFVKDPNQAAKAAVGTVLGIFAGMTFKLVLGTAMVISFLVVVL